MPNYAQEVETATRCAHLGKIVNLSLKRAPVCAIFCQIAGQKSGSFVQNCPQKAKISKHGLNWNICSKII